MRKATQTRSTRPSRRPIESLERRVLLAAGALDPTFGANGIASFNTDLNLKLRDAVVQTDGKIVAVFGNSDASAIARFNPNGSPDNTFGSSGRLVGSALGEANHPSTIAIQADGKIVAAGGSGSIGVTRYLSNGNVDSTFGNGGSVFISNQAFLTASDMLVRSDDRIVIGGSLNEPGPNDGEPQTNDDFALFALTANGATDSAFGSGAGFVTTDFNGTFDSIDALAFLSDGRIVASGSSITPRTESSEAALALYNADGTPATGFSGDGKLLSTQVSLSEAAGRLLAVSGDKIIVMDPFFGPNGDQVAVAQFTTAGILDASFGENGVAVPLNTEATGRAFTGAITVDPAGRPVIAYDKAGIGTTAFDIARLVRLLPDGSVDPTFNDAGVFNSAGFVGGPSKLLQGPGKTLVLATSITNDDLVMARYDATSAPMPTVVGSPVASTTANTVSIRVSYAGDAAIDPASIAPANVRLTGPANYSTLATSTASVTPSGNILAVTYVFPAPGGTLEPADNGNYTLLSEAGGVKDAGGNVVPPQEVGAFDLAIGVVLPDVAFSDTGFSAGSYIPGDQIPATLTTTTATGTVSSYNVTAALSADVIAGNSDDIPLQTTTVTTGTATLNTLGPIPQDTPVGNYFLVARIDPADAVAESDESNNTLVSSTASIEVTPPPPEKPSLTIGGLDPTFGVGGVIRPTLFFSSTVGALEQPGGTIIIAGSRGELGSRDVGLTRRVPTGPGDNSWGDNGLAIVDLRGTDDHVVDFQVLSDGSILVAGTSTEVDDEVTVGSDFFVLRFDADGNRDMAFGGQGVAFIDFASDPASPSTDVAREILVAGDGSILIVGRTDSGGDFDFALARLTAAGAPDTSFGSGGRVITDFGSGDDGAQAVAFSTSGSIVAAGFATDAGDRRVAVARYLPTGVLDSKFGMGGLTTATAGGADERANAVAVNAKGTVLVAGYTANGSIVAGNYDSDFLVARFNARGKLDRKFSSDGVVAVSLANPATATHVEVLPAGQILTSGVSSAAIAQGGDDNYDLAVVRFTDAGALDPSFGAEGVVTIPSGTGLVVTPNAATRPLAADGATPLDLAPADALEEFQNTAEGKVMNRVGGGAFISGTSGDQTLVAALITSGIELSGELIAPLPTAVVGGTKGSAKVNIVNLGDTFADGTVDILFFTSTDDTLNSGDRQFFGLEGKKLKLKPLTLKGKARKFNARFAFPDDIPDGTYFLLAQVNAASNIDELDPNNNAAISDTKVQISAPVVDLGGPDFGGGITFNSGKPTVIPITLANAGTIPLKVAADMTFVFSADEVVDDGDQRVGPVTAKVNLKPQASKVANIRLTAPPLEPGSYFLFVLLDPLNSVAEKDESNNLLASAVPSTLP